MKNKKKADQQASPDKTRPHDINFAEANTNAGISAARARLPNKANDANPFSPTTTQPVLAHC